MNESQTIPGPSRPTLWGLSPTQLHDQFWASRGVHVVRQGEDREVPDDAELYLLTDPRTLAIFRLRQLVDLLSWVEPNVLFVRLSIPHQSSYQEVALCDVDSQFIGFQRCYEEFGSRFARLVLTRDRNLAMLWRDADDVPSAWRQLRRESRSGRREVARARGHVYDRFSDTSTAHFVRELIRFWPHPRTTVADVRLARSGVWAHTESEIEDNVRFIGPVWIGAGRRLTGSRSVVGPAALWDDPAARPAPSRVAWDSIEPVNVPSLARPVRPRATSSANELSKRLFDIVFAIVALLLTAPLYPLIMLAIWLEDGEPFFFGHQREGKGGREFSCVKFRSMRKDADDVRRQLARVNQADGPQFYIKDDPRITRVGRFLRKTNLDELPQFWNVLLGDMSVVGPRPSPRKENQYCPPWREARLSVRPGITGLWQVSRTRRQGLDFQEWIKYDTEYVERASWGLDLSIIFRTFGVMLRGVLNS